MKWIFVAASIVALSGCVNIPLEADNSQKERAAIEAALDAAVAKCRADWESDVRLDPIRAKIPLSFAAASFPQLNDTSKPNAAEKAAIIALDEVRESCNQPILMLQARVWPQQRTALMRQHFADARAMLGTLWKGSITYGQYLTDSSKLFNSYMYADERLAGELATESRRTQAQMEQARSARMQAMSQYMQANKPPQIQQIYVPPPRQSQQTDCNQWAPGHVRCTTR